VVVNSNYGELAMRALPEPFLKRNDAAGGGDGLAKAGAEKIQLTDTTRATDCQSEEFR